MLRITKFQENGSSVILKLEGKVADQWAALLEGECRTLLRHRKLVELDFSGVDFIDQSGVEVLRSLPHKQVKFLNAPGYIEELLGEGGR